MAHRLSVPPPPWCGRRGEDHGDHRADPDSRDERQVPYSPVALGELALEPTQLRWQRRETHRHRLGLTQATYTAERIFRMALLSPSSHVIVRGNGSPWKAARNGRLGPANPLASPPGAITALHGHCVTIRLEAVAFCVPLPETGPLVSVHGRNRLRLARRGDRRSNGGAAEYYCRDGESRQGALDRRAARRRCFCSDVGCTSSCCQPHCSVLPPVAGR